MSTLTRTVRTFSRKYSTAFPGSHGSTKESMILWKRLSFFVGGPAIALSMLNCYLNNKNGHGDRVEFVKYEHMRIRTKPFPWGDGNHTLFHNPHTNALPNGYEDAE